MAAKNSSIGRGALSSLVTFNPVTGDIVPGGSIVVKGLSVDVMKRAPQAVDMYDAFPVHQLRSLGQWMGFSSTHLFWFVKHSDDMAAGLKELDGIRSDLMSIPKIKMSGEAFPPFAQLMRYIKAVSKIGSCAPESTHIEFDDDVMELYRDIFVIAALIDMNRSISPSPLLNLNSFLFNTRPVAEKDLNAAGRIEEKLTKDISFGNQVIKWMVNGLIYRTILAMKSWGLVHNDMGERRYEAKSLDKVLDDWKEIIKTINSGKVPKAKNIQPPLVLRPTTDGAFDLNVTNNTETPLEISILNGTIFSPISYPPLLDMDLLPYMAKLGNTPIRDIDVWLASGCTLRDIEHSYVYFLTEERYGVSASNALEFGLDPWPFDDPYVKAYEDMLSTRFTGSKVSRTECTLSAEQGILNVVMHVDKSVADHHTCLLKINAPPFQKEGGDLYYTGYTSKETGQQWVVVIYNIVTNEIVPFTKEGLILNISSIGKFDRVDVFIYELELFAGFVKFYVDGFATKKTDPDAFVKVYPAMSFSKDVLNKVSHVAFLDHRTKKVWFWDAPGKTPANGEYMIRHLEGRLKTELKDYIVKIVQGGMEPAEFWQVFEKDLKPTEDSIPLEESSPLIEMDISNLSPSQQARIKRVHQKGANELHCNACKMPMVLNEQFNCWYCERCRIYYCGHCQAVMALGMDNSMHCYKCRKI